MRVTLESGSAAYSSKNAAVLPPDGVWRAVTFDLTDAAMTSIGNTATLSQVLSNVQRVRVLSGIGGPTSQGDTLAGVIGLDNVRAEVIPVPVPTVTEFIFVNNQPRISFTTVNGRSYRVDWKPTITAADWITLSNATNVAGTGGVVQVTDTEPGVRNLPMRFYRVVLLP
jgi:hypothetical protein